MVYEHDAPPQMVDVGQPVLVGNVLLLVVSRQQRSLALLVPTHLDR
jgi:hypothetical protein